MTHLTQQPEWITLGQTSVPPLEASPSFYEIFVLAPHTVVSTIIAKEKETIAIIIVIIMMINNNDDYDA